MSKMHIIVPIFGLKWAIIDLGYFVQNFRAKNARYSTGLWFDSGYNISGISHFEAKMQIIALVFG